MQEGAQVLRKCYGILCKGPSRMDEDTSAKWGSASAFSRSPGGSDWTPTRTALL